jgi:peroxiredoxin
MPVQDMILLRYNAFYVLLILKLESPAPQPIFVALLIKSPFIMAIQIGQPAPDFTLFSTAREEVSLNQLKGKNVVLLFFPQAFTSTCTTELCSIRDGLTSYNNMNAEVFGVSVDSVFTLGEYKKKENLNFELLSDFNKDISTAYDALYEDFVFGMKGVSKRAAFVIDQEGTVRYAEVLENAGNLPDFDAIQQTLASLN